MAGSALASRARLLLDPIGRAAVRRRGPSAALVRSALARPLEDAERDWVERIESVRAGLERRTDTVRFDVPGGPGDREVGEMCRTSSQTRPWAELLFRLVRQLRPERCLELGTCVGISAAYGAAALELNGAGRLVTIEGQPAAADIAAETLARLGLAGRAECRVGWFDAALEPALRDLGGVDHALIDGHHEGGPTLDYFRRIRPWLSRGATVVVDDIDWSGAMHEAWEAVANDSRTADALDLGRLGLWSHV